MDYNHRLTIDDETRAERIERAAVELRDALVAMRKFPGVRDLFAPEDSFGSIWKQGKDALRRFDAARRGET